MEPCGTATIPLWPADAAASALRAANGSVAFIFVRAVHRSLTWLPELASAVANAPRGSGIHLVQKRELTPKDAACVRSLDRFAFDASFVPARAQLEFSPAREPPRK